MAKVTLISCPTNADRLAGLAAATCTRSSSGDKARSMAMESGHESIAEHCSFTFMIEGMSRVTLAQFTRHRMASYSVESQRYAGIQTDVVIPPSVESMPDAVIHWNNAIRAAQRAYDALCAMGVPKEDARYISPQGVATRMLVTMNARELRHFFALRCCNRAQWEIRDIARQMLKLCREKAPELFADAGPACVRGACREKRPCGRPWAVKDRG